MANPVARAAAAPVPAPPANRSATGDELGKQDFLLLLVAQLRNQDPMKPMEDKEFITQMAQFRTLETMLSLEQQIGAFAAVQVFGEATALIGKTVEAKLADNSTVVGVVSEVSLVGNTPRLVVGDRTVDLGQIVTVKGERDAAARAASADGGAAAPSPTSGANPTPTQTGDTAGAPGRRPSDQPAESGTGRNGRS